VADLSVRPAREADAVALAAVQVASWQVGYAATLPPAILDWLAAQADDFARAWAEAAVRPPTYRHRVLVACEGSDVVAGASLGPAEDEDLDPGTEAEVFTFAVDPAHRRAGHGSRLLSASVDLLRGAGFSAATIWLDRHDVASRELFTTAGWADDGSTRRLDLDGDGSVVVEQLRMHTDLTEGRTP
jgi:ribosomal protein S18 acetylase RimI-like enzyme